jgi:ribosomal 30S subunit maturation factor RimM
VREEDKPELDEGEFYSRDLVGMRVVLKVCAYYHDV